jgi:hypothetical protein
MLKNKTCRARGCTQDTQLHYTREYGHYGFKKSPNQNSRHQSLENYKFCSKASQSAANEKIEVEVCTQPNKLLNLSESF